MADGDRGSVVLLVGLGGSLLLAAALGPLVAVADVLVTRGRAQLAADVVISEFMASNSRTLADRDGDFSDWIEIHNARVMVGDGNAQAAAYAADHGLPGVAASDAHSVLEVGVAYTALDGDPSTADGLLAALPSAELIGGRASYYVRLITPMAKAIQRVRGNRRPVAPGGAS